MPGGRCPPTGHAWAREPALSTSVIQRHRCARCGWWGYRLHDREPVVAYVEAKRVAELIELMRRARGPGRETP